MMRVLTMSMLMGCSTIHYTNQGTIPVSFSLDDSMKRHVEVEGKKPFFLWGFFPKSHEVFIDHEFRDKGIDQIVGLEIHEYSDGWDAFFSIITVGFYIPRTYKLKGQTRRIQI